MTPELGRPPVCQLSLISQVRRWPWTFDKWTALCGPLSISAPLSRHNSHECLSMGAWSRLGTRAIGPTLEPCMCSPPPPFRRLEGDRGRTVHHTRARLSPAGHRLRPRLRRPGVFTILVVVKQHLVQIGRIHGPTEHKLVEYMDLPSTNWSNRWTAAISTWSMPSVVAQLRGS